jgi:hypothetical protein
MIRFLDGPAMGQSLELKRTPRFLRVVHSAAGTWDALDLIADVPREDETIHVYQIDGQAGFMHLDYTERRTGRLRSKTYLTADYRYYPVQPDDATARDTASWQAWCAGQAGGERFNG